MSGIYTVYSASENSNQLLNDIITDKQKDILLSILGNIEYYNFEQDFSAGVPTSQKWLDFLNGADYTVNSVVYPFAGIKPVLVKFIYYHWQRETVSILGESGELYSNTNRLLKVVPRNKMVSAYNKACYEVSNCDSYSPTVYHFLTEHPTYDFDDLVFKGIEKINTYNL
jgi:hypothetical protein